MSEIPRDPAAQLLSELEERSGRPLRAMLEVSDRCNEVCVHCYQVQGQKGEMSTEQIKALMDELAEMGILLLTISGGEATLRHDFIELLEHARKRSFAVRLYTNGLTMTRELALEMKRLALQSIEISLYSHRAEVHDFVTGVPGSFERTVAGIRYLRELGVSVHVKTPVMRVNQDELHAYVEFVSALGASHGFDPGALTAREGGDLAPTTLSRSEETHARLLRDPSLGGVARDMTRDVRPLELRALDDMLCGAGAAVHVEANGELRACSSLEVPLGHVSQGVEHARETNAVMQSLRELRWKNVHGCRDCDLRAYCGRCHAMALVEAGDALAPYATACASARTVYAVSMGRAAEIAPRGPSEIADVGPYQHVEGHRFEAIADLLTEEDVALAERLKWTRREGGAVASTYAGAQADTRLVQLRRPGRSGRRALTANEIPDSLKGALENTA